MERVSSLSLCHRQAAVAPHELISSFCLSRFDTRGKNLARTPALPVALHRQGIGTLTPVLTRFMAT